MSVTPGDSTVICARELSKSFTIQRQRPGLLGAARSFLRRDNETRVVVNQLDLAVQRGELVGLLGPNGAGKTTIVKMCTGLIRPSTGSLQVLGHQPSRRSFDFLRQISVIFGQKTMLWWDVPAQDSFLVHRQMYDLDRDQFQRTVADLTELLDLADIITVPVRKLSLGQRMRCELALALLHQPTLLFADEPTIGLDVIAKQTLRGFFAQVNQELGTTIVLTSHDMDDVQALCRRILLVEHGRIGFDGDLDTLRATVLPQRHIQARYADPVTPPPDLGPVTQPAPSILELDVSPAVLSPTVRRLTGLGTLLDLTVTEADLDQIMAQRYRHAARGEGVR